MTATETAPVGRNRIEDREGTAAQIVELREEGKSFKEISDEIGIHPGTVKLLFMEATEELYDFKNDAQLAKLIAKDRDQGGMSWGRIQARAGGLTKGAVQKLYKEASGRDASESDLGRGGGRLKGKEGGYRTRPKPESNGEPKRRGRKPKATATGGVFNFEGPLTKEQKAQVKEQLSGNVVTVGDVTHAVTDVKFSAKSPDTVGLVVEGESKPVKVKLAEITAVA